MLPQSRILLIDDAVQFRHALRAALESAGMHVTEASEGIEGLWRVRNEAAFDLLVVDVHMPTMDGLAFIREFKAMEPYARTPIVVVTSDGSRERRSEGRALGVTAWLLKPPDMAALVKSILAALYRSSTPNDPGESRAAG
jgi:two-component system, chemotaxis family, chemotaxis protein CheY